MGFDGGSARVDQYVEGGVPYYVHDYYGPGRHAKIISTTAKNLLNGPEVVQAAWQAIAEIQARLPGASPGQLSLATAETGQLSLAPADQAGELSLPPEKP